VWQQKYLEAETKLKTIEAENTGLKDRMARFVTIAEEVRKERRMHEEVRLTLYFSCVIPLPAKSSSVCTVT